MEIARGKWIVFLDSDDILDEYALIHILKEKQTSICDLITFGYYVKREGKYRNYSNKEYANQFFEGDQFLKLFLSKKLNLNISSIAYNKEFLLKNRIEFSIGQKIGEDLCFIILCLSKCNKSYYNNYHFFTYQVENSSAMKGYNLYTTDMAKGLVSLNKFINSVRKVEMDKFYDFYLANSYIYNLLLLLKSRRYEKQAVKILLMNVSLIDFKLKPLNFKKYIILRLVQLFPVKTLLHYFIWRSKT